MAGGGAAFSMHTLPRGYPEDVVRVGEDGADNVFDAGRDAVDGGVGFSGGTPAGGRTVNNAEDFVDMVVAVFGNFSTQRSEHLFLTCLTGMMTETLHSKNPQRVRDFHDILFQREGVLEKLVDMYFTSPRVISEQVRDDLRTHLVRFLSARNESDQSPLSLEPNPIVVFEDLRHVEYPNDGVRIECEWMVMMMMMMMMVMQELIDCRDGSLLRVHTPCVPLSAVLNAPFLSAPYRLLAPRTSSVCVGVCHLLYGS